MDLGRWGEVFHFGKCWVQWVGSIADGRTFKYPLDRACELRAERYLQGEGEVGDSHGQLGLKVQVSAVCRVQDSRLPKQPGQPWPAMAERHCCRH